ncbi:MAG: hypothetical protein M1435_03535, partial [Actinobacteria bacterium]|nr:hypothetical protein [Actinomycetota bacterium]
MTPAQELLEAGATYLRAFLQPSGELYDPVFGEPTQYGTAYFAYVNAAMGRLGRGASAASYFESAERGLEAVLGHLLDPDDAPATSSYDPPIASPVARNHRDFMWLPVLRVLGLLRAEGRPGVDALADQVRRVAVPEVFAARPPHNWAAVWLAGEWLRIRDGLSPNPPQALDAWLEPFFDGQGARVNLERGCYYEPGYPNSYDLFTRYHLMELLAEGYLGRYRRHLEQLLDSGLRRSLALQLSDGSLASAHRSTGQVWTLTAQCAYFCRGAQLCADEALALRAREAATRALTAALACQRPEGGLSPVQNVLPANFRVGYEPYSADAHYVALALSFLATAVLAGFTGADGARETGAGPLQAGAYAHVDPEPLWRSLLQGEGWSVHVNLAPQAGYDAFGIADVSAGTGRYFRFGGQVHHVASGSPLTLGLAVRDGAGGLAPLAGARSVGGRFSHFDPAEHCLEAGAVADGLAYRLRVSVEAGELSVVESAGDKECSLVVPYLADRGDGARPQVGPGRAGVRFCLPG